MFSKEINFDRFVRGLIFLVIIVAAYFLVNELSGILLPFFVAWLVAYMLYPIVIFFEKTCHLRSRLLCIFITILLVASVLGVLGWLCIPVFMDQVAHLKEVAIDFFQNGARNSTIPRSIETFMNQHASQLNIERILKEKDVQTVLRDTLPRVWNVLWSTAGVVISIISSLIGLIYLFFLLMDYEKFARGWIEFVPYKHRHFVGQLVGDVVHGMSRYFRGQALVALSNCVMFSIGFWLIDFPIPVALGIFIGVISFVPYLQLLGFLPAIILALLKAAESDANFWVLIGGVVVVYSVVQILQDTIFTPKIMGKFMGLNPAVILLSLSVWGYLLGLIGLIIALPMTTLMISYYKRYIIGQEVETVE